MSTFLGGINGVVRYPNRGYATSERYVKYLIGQMNNVKTYEDRLKWWDIAGQLYRQNKITAIQTNMLFDEWEKRVMKPVMRNKSKRKKFNQSVKEWEKKNPQIFK